MPETISIENSRFRTPEEEIQFLRQELLRRESEARTLEVPPTRETIAQKLVTEYKHVPAESVIHPELQARKEEGIQLRLSPEAHDEMTAEYMTVMLEKGVKNALDAVRETGNPHLDDDFHRFLVQYLLSYHALPGLEPKQELYKALDTVLFEITLPDSGMNAPEAQQDYRKLIGLMEQFFAGMQSVGSHDNKEKNFYSLEIAVNNIGKETIFYASIPRQHMALFEKQILGLYHTAKLREVSDDYNIFNPEGVHGGLYAQPIFQDILQIKTYDHFDNDPLEVLLNTFSKIEHMGEGVALQLILRPAGDVFLKQFTKTLESLKKGEKLKDIYATFGQDLKKGLKDLGKNFFESITSGGNEPEKKTDDIKRLDDDAIANITEKLKSTIMEANIRVIASARDEVRMRSLLQSVASAFNQFTDPKGGGLKFVEVPNKHFKDFAREFSYRMFDKDHTLALNFKELATLFHLPAATKGAPMLKQAKSGSAPAPLEIGKEGILIGHNEFRGTVTPIYFAPQDRLRHFYTIGQTGVGKTQLFLKMLIQDIKNGDGCCYIDPHGNDINTVLANIPPERMDDVIYFDPSYTERPMGLNMMEFDERFPIQKSLVTAELLSIFDKLFDMKAQGGAMFGQYFRNSALLVMEDPASGNTLLEITRVLQSKEFRQMKLAKCQNPIISEFWRSAESIKNSEQSLENFVPYISSKFDDFISNEIMRPIVLQEKSAFNFRRVMDEKKILLVNLSKGLLGEKNATLLGLVLVGKLQMAALSRADNPLNTDFPPFYMYIDEFQNVTTESITSILSEARKYKLSLNITHQYLDQLPESIKGAVFGNVGSMAFFRIKAEDAVYVEPRVAPTFTKDDIVKLDNFNAVASMLVNGRPARAFNIHTTYDGFPPKGTPEHIDKVKQLSYLTYGRPRAEVEEEIRAKYARNNGASL